MRAWDADRIAAEIGPSARVLAFSGGPDGPARAIIDSRQAGPGALFFGLPGRNTDGGDEKQHNRKCAGDMIDERQCLDVATLVFVFTKDGNKGLRKSAFCKHPAQQVG